MEEATRSAGSGRPRTSPPRCVYLGSRAGQYVTGKMLEVDGGMQVPNLDLGLPDLDPRSADAFSRVPDELRSQHRAAISPDSGRHWADEGAWEVGPGIHRIPLPLPMDGLKAINVYVVQSDDG